jgi:hypothetical protein
MIHLKQMKGGDEGHVAHIKTSTLKKKINQLLNKKTHYNITFFFIFLYKFFHFILHQSLLTIIKKKKITSSIR